MPDIHKVGLLAVENGRILLCRRRKDRTLILPGGKIEPGESHHDCLLREIEEELGRDVEVRDIEYVGAYSDRAAGDADRIVHIDLYRGNLIGAAVASSEIGELVWFAADDDRAQLAPSLIRKILPDLIARGILPWEPTP